MIRRYLGFVSVQMRVGKSQHDDGALSMGMSLGEVIPDPSPNPEEAMIAREQRNTLTEAVEAAITDPRERKVADRMLSALDGVRSHGWSAELARELGITKGAVSKIQGRVVDKVANWIKDRKIA